MNSRIRILLYIVLVGALVILVRLYFIQIKQGDTYRERSERQANRASNLLFSRGSIFFEGKDGAKISFATIQDGFALGINPQEIINPEESYEKLIKFVYIDKVSFYQKVLKKDSKYIELVKKVDTETVKEIQNLDIPGIVFQKTRWRIYPAGRTASHSLGLLGFLGDELAGRYGLERFYEDSLSKNDDLVTTIDPSVQGYLENVLKKTNEEWKPDTIGGIIMNPKTGEIYALTALPDFNPNDVSKEKDVKIFSNPLVENAYEMGSIIKPLTIAVGLDTKIIDTKFTYYDEGTLTIDKKKISNFDGKARGTVPLQEVLNQSLNIGIAHIVERIGKDYMSKYFKDLGIGDYSNIDQPNETKGIATNLDSPRLVEYVTSGFGQGISMNPIVTVRALSTLANQGKLPNPHLVKKIEYENGKEKILDYDKQEQVFKKESAEEVTKMLVEVVDKALKHGEIKMERYSIAAKTGTAQIAKPIEGGYYTDRYLHSFFGYFPAYNPKFIVFLFQVNPKGANYASETLTMPFADITSFLINYFEIPPDR